MMSSLMNRGQRSAIGTYGFFGGGFLIDRGVEAPGKLSKLDVRLEIPQQWRFVLLVPAVGPAQHGQLENVAFEELSESHNSGRDRMVELCNEHIAPAVAGNHYQQLGEPLFELNRLSGQYFSKYQYGCYHSELCAQVVDHIRSCGVTAVGQSSWGPCVFAVTADQSAAEGLIAQLRTDFPAIYSPSNIDITVAEPDNCGFKMHQPKSNTTT